MAIPFEWEKIREGDKKAFNQSFDLYYLPLCSFISRYINEKSVIEDLVVDCFARVWENRLTLDIKSSFQNYLITIVKNSAISYLRKHQFQYIGVENLANRTIEDETNPLEDAEQLNRMYDAINRLPEKRRLILKMAAFENKSYAEIADELHISVNTVKTQMSRSYDFLRSELNVSQKIIMSMLFV
jgi:RNA polymerase sigma-70 factor, ECF subfamily